MNRITNILWRCLAIAVAISATGADGYNTLSHAVNAEMTKDIIVTLAVIIVVMSLALPASVWSFKRQNRTYGALGAIVFLAAWSVSYGFSVNRMGTNRSNEAATYSRANLVGVIAEEKRLEAKNKLENAKAILAKEAVSGRGPIWKEAKNNLDQAQIDYDIAERQVLKAGPTKRSETFEQTGYLVYLLPFVAQASGVVFFLIGFGEMRDSEKTKKTKRRANQQRVIDQLKSTVPDEKEAVLEFLKNDSKSGYWESRYRKISEATGVSIGSVKPALDKLVIEKCITVDGCTKGRGTWGRILENEYT